VVTESWDDEELLTALRQAVSARQAVPPEFVTAGKSAFAWHNIDAELAQLTYDSTLADSQAVAMRAEAASIRSLTFSSTHLTIELEVTADSLIGQIVPAQTGSIEMHNSAGSVVTIPSDEIGCFMIQPIPPSPFRLRCRTAADIDVLTGWITL